MSLDETIKFKKNLEEKNETYWINTGGLKALKLFKKASAEVPAYKDFLKKNKIDPKKIKTMADFKFIPTVNKKNYLRAYEFNDLCWGGNPGAMNMISVSSGSTGEPFYWLRGKEQEQETTLLHELFLIDSFGIDKCSTLFIVSFAMGMWVAGTLTYKCVQDIAQKYNMTVTTPGINIGDVLKTVKSLGKYYDQIILAGYPPFIKDIVDQGEYSGINWKKYKVKFLFAAEQFSEKWREYILKKTGSAEYFKDSLNIYGTADALVMGHETPLSILIRQAANGNKSLYRDIFRYDERVPTLVQFNPTFKFTEIQGDNLLFTYSGGIPLIRYDIGDSGGVVKYSDMQRILYNNGIDINKEAKLKNITPWKLPFMYVYGRSDLTASIYGLNIYPENIRDALSGKGVDKHVSGKFTMLTKNDKKLNQYLEINIELKKGAVLAKDLSNNIQESIVGVLRNKNNEYNELYKKLGSGAEPKVILCQYGDKNFFTPGTKQKWHQK